MTKELSKQLCELCGIEPVNNTIISCGCEDRTRYLRLYDPKRCQGCNSPIKAKNYKEIHTLQYPDFGKPENFIKLFKLITTIEDYDYNTGLYYMPHIPAHQQQSCLSAGKNRYYSENSDPIKAFITCVIACVNDDKDTADYIKEQEWNYD